MEVDTPLAVVCPGTEVHLRYFPTEWLDYHGRTQRLYLRSSPELHMKQTLALGAERIFQLAPCFRSGGEYSQWHHPEFTMLEWYECGLSFSGLIDQTEELLRFSHKYTGSSLALPKQFARISVAEAFKLWVGLDLGRVELCNGFDELLGAEANQKRLSESNRRRSDYGYEVPGTDAGFAAALNKGIKPCSGNALGFDRWLALLLGLDQIASVIPFRDSTCYASAKDSD